MIDPTTGYADAYDDRAPRVEKVADPVRSRRGRASRKRGVKTELELARLFEASGCYVLRQGGPNRRDFVVIAAGQAWSCESKSITGRWPRPAEVAAAWTQAVRQADIHRPLLVFCLRKQGVKSLYRCYYPDGFEDLQDWLGREVQT